MNFIRRYSFLVAMFFMFFVQNANAKDANYFHYHNLINRAETNFFLHENVDSAIYLYKKAFKNFDFVFAKDCIMAAQIAVYAKRNDDAVLFINKGFEQGIIIEMLQPIKVFTNFLKDEKILQQLKTNYPLLHKKYLARINVNMLRKITVAYYNDELNKVYSESYHPPYGNYINGEYKENPVLENKVLAKQLYDNYVDIRINNVNMIDSFARTIGFPGEKLTGIEQQYVEAGLSAELASAKKERVLKQPGLLSELGYANEECKSRLDKLTSQQLDTILNGKNVPPKVKDYEYKYLKNTMVSGDISDGKVFIILIHLTSTYCKLQDLWMNAIKKGEVHPRDVACFYDASLKPDSGLRVEDREYKNKVNCKINKPYSNYFYLNYLVPYNKLKDTQLKGYNNPFAFVPLIDTKQTNEMRRALYMVDYGVDLAKNKYQKEYGFKIRFGEFGQL